jgi:type II secretory pathway pseudopilin PulG
VSGRRLAAALAAIALLTLVLPPLVARQVHAHRIDRARAVVERLAAVLQAEGAIALGEPEGPLGPEPFVLAGPGASPAFTHGVGWPVARVHSVAATPGPSSLSARAWDELDATPDPWGNQYLVVIGVGSARQLTVISAGPNGTIETPFGSDATPKGDDIVAVR